MKFLLLALMFAVSAHASANEPVRQAKISQIVEAQGLLQMLQQQLDQAKIQASELGKDIYQKILAESGGKENSKIEQAFARYMERCSTIFTAEEFVEIWSRFYGSELSEAELDGILAYYQSPIGRKDVVASQAALLGFSQVVNAEGQRRINDAIGQLMSDLKAAMETGDPAGADAAR
jgi:hypothetical protein